MSTTVAPRTTRVYLSGRGIQAVDILNAAQSHKHLHFVIGHNNDAISLTAETAALDVIHHDVKFSGHLASGEPFTGSYSERTTTGALDVELR